MLIVRAFQMVLLFGFALLGACQSLPKASQVPLTDTHHTIYFIYQGWHTSILLSASAVAPYSRVLKSDLSGQHYLRVGWGDGDFFTGKSKTLGAATRALFVSDYSAIQILTYQQNPLSSIPQETRVPLALTANGMRRLVRYIERSIQLDKQGYPISLPSYLENAGRFYLAKNHYSLFSNCNTWSSRALREAGLPVRSRWHLTPQSVFAQASAISSIQTDQGQVIANKW